MVLQVQNLDRLGFHRHLPLVIADSLGNPHRRLVTAKRLERRLGIGSQTARRQKAEITILWR